MDNTEAIEIIKTAIAHVEWDYPMDYAAAFEKAVEALKEQEPVAPDYRQVLVGSNGAFVLESHCGACGCGIMKNDRWRTKYCPECGKAVKWE